MGRLFQTEIFPSGFTCVVKFANMYIAAHLNDDESSSISPLTVDITIAQAAAKAFAETNYIDYDADLFECDSYIITVLKCNNGWSPAELHANEIVIINLGVTFQDATKIAINMALKNMTVFMPADIELE